MIEHSKSPEMAELPEKKRDRVRRLLLNPLGFRFPKSMEPAEARKRLDRLTDDLTYMDDDRLVVMAQMLRSHGQGSARNFWPDHATFIGLAEVVQPRPLEELPALLSWFGSVEGPRAIEASTLVETWLYISKRKVPPVSPRARALVAETAAENARRLLIIGERLAAGINVSKDDLEWRRWYVERRNYCEAIVARERSARAKGDAA